MSREATASVYTMMLNDEGYKDLVADDPSVLDEWDLTDEERQLLLDEAGAEVSGFAIGAGALMHHIRFGPPLPQPVASSFGIALNRAAGLPAGALQGPGFAADGCCPWNKPPSAPSGGMVE
jgi:hypothetical protein